MSKIANMLKQEITRLARKEVNAGTRALRKSNAQYRRDIAELKRQIAELHRRLKDAERREKRRTESPAASEQAESVAENLRFSASGRTSQRRGENASAVTRPRATSSPIACSS